MSYLVRNYGDTDFITGIRFIAATMVIAIHTGAFRDFGSLGGIITDNGKYGVQIFFVISGFTIARTYRGAAGFGTYFGRRLMRIAPLYFCAILFAFSLIAGGFVPKPHYMTQYGSEADAYNLLMHLSFLSAWDARIANSLLAVEWSIPIEIFWYAVLPVLLPLPKSRRQIGLIILALLILSGATRAASHAFLPDHAGHFLPLTYGAYFYIGALAETLRDRAQAQPLSARNKATMAAGLVFLAGLLTDTGFNAALLGLATAALIVFHPGRSGRASVLSLRPLLFLGSISYSLYLMHPIVLYMYQMNDWQLPGPGLLVFGQVLGLTVLVSTVTYLVIEYPSNQLGRRLFGSARASATPGTTD